MKKKRIALVLACILSLSMTACSTPGGNGGTEEGSGTDDSQEKVFRYPITADVTTLDPQLGNELHSSTICYHIGEGLTRSVDGKVQEGIAESWDISEDGMTYTFHLRDAKYSDGEPIKASDFEYAMKRLVDPATASSFAFIAKPLLNATEITSGAIDPAELGVKAIDDKTLECKLAFPASYFLQILSMPHFYPTRQDIVEEYGEAFASNGDKNVYSGPFVLKEWKQNDRIILEKNPEYWNASEVYLDRVEVLVVSDENTALAMYESGELDFVNVPTDAVQNYEDVEFYRSGIEDLIKLNTEDGLLANRNFRLALNYGLNRDEFIRLSSNGVWEAASRFVLPEVGSVKDTFGEEYPYEAFPLTGDQQKAKEYLDTALQELDIANASDIHLELLTSDVERTKKEAEVLQALYKESLGINIDVKLLPAAEKVEKETSGDFEMVATGMMPDTADPISFLESWETTSPYNKFNYSNKEYDKLLQKAYHSGDAKDRMDTLAEAETVLMDDAAIIPLQFRRNAKLVNPNITGITTYFTGYSINYIHGDIK